MNLKALIKLEKNPHYVLNEEQKLALANYRNVKHKSKVQKHNTKLKEEK